MSLDRYAPALALVLLIGGFGVLGSVAGFRVAFAVVAEELQCAGQVTVTGPTACQRVLLELNELTKIALVGGIISMITGGVGYRYTAHE